MASKPGRAVFTIPDDHQHRMSNNRHS